MSAAPNKRRELTNTCEIPDIRDALAVGYVGPVGREVEFADVRRRIEEFGDRATVITVAESNKPHVVSAVVEVADGRLTTRVGQRTATNLAECSSLCLLWQPVDGGEYQLIVDGIAERVDAVEGPEGVAEISIVVTRGILHRLAGLPDDGPSCVALDG